MKMQRVVVYLPHAAITACETAAEKYGSTRSEVIRLAIADGLRGAVEALERLRDVRLLEAAGAGAARVWKGRGTVQAAAGGSSGKPLDPDRAVSALVEFGRTVRAADPDLDADQLRVGLQMQAHAISVDPVDLDEVLVDVLAQLFDEPQLESVPDPSRPPE